MLRSVLIMLLSGLLAACSPTYDWREIPIDDGAVSAYFPDKPITQTRPLNFSGHDLSFALTSAPVDDVLFTVAYAALPPALQNDPQAGKAFATAVMQSLYRNLGAEAPETLPAFGEPFQIDGNSPQGPIRLRATMWLTEHALVEALVTGETASFPAAQADEFLRGVKVAR